MLEDRHLSVAEAARRMRHIPAQRVYDVIKKRRNVSVETAVLLGELFDMSPQFWLHLAADYDLWEALQARKAANRAS